MSVMCAGPSLVDRAGTVKYFCEQIENNLPTADRRPYRRLELAKQTRDILVNMLAHVDEEINIYQSIIKGRNYE